MRDPLFWAFATSVLGLMSRPAPQQTPVNDLSDLGAELAARRLVAALHSKTVLPGRQWRTAKNIIKAAELWEPDAAKSIALAKARGWIDVEEAELALTGRGREISGLEIAQQPIKLPYLPNPESNCHDDMPSTVDASS